MSIYRQKLMLTQNHNGFSVKSEGVLTPKHGHGLEESAGDPRGGGVAQRRSLPEPRRPEVSRVRAVAGVEAPHRRKRQRAATPLRAWLYREHTHACH